ncbi:MAG: epoxyqueuosine reductase QueH [Chloroflexi bacterium]|nr:epoxyqueuosine reductase QueH [Chloroflexota bacterium]
MKTVLHICCGICAAGVAERLLSEGHEVSGFFYNPNIHPAKEYECRLEVARRVAGELGFPLAVGQYGTDRWFEATNGLETEPEGGRRCPVCFRLRLEKTFSHMQEKGCDAFTTTLTVSPSKSALVVNQIGQEIGGDRFLARDFKKKDGFKRSIELAKKWELYRQHYCGCIFSLRQAQAKAGAVFRCQG